MAISTPYLDALISEGVSATPSVEVFEEIRDLLGTVYGNAVGSVTLAGTSAGVAVTIDDLGTVDYDVFYWIEVDSTMTLGQQGEIQIVRDSSTQFTVINSGSDNASTLYYRVFKRTA
jgi:hypothetical protein